jgi:type II secretory pathway pseudopilin PulG
MNEKANFYQSTFGFFFSVDFRRESLLALSVNRKNRLKSRCYKSTFPITKSIKYNQLKKYKRIPGLSLIETALTLVIAGIVISLTLPMLTTAQRSNRHQITQTHQHQLMLILAGYAVKHDRLPIPSTPDKKGKSVDLEKDDFLASKAVGIIPYKELGISETMARDGHGHWFTYAVVPDLLTNDLSGDLMAPKIMPNQYFCHQVVPKKMLELKSLRGDSLLREQSATTDFIAVILISHGSKGSGAFHPTKNEHLPVSKDHFLEAKNSNNELEFVARTKDDNNHTFDHDIFWVTRNNLLAVYGKCPCQPLPYQNATTVIKTSSSSNLLF